MERFGEYRLVQYLTAGGMADLYLARHPRWEQLLVVKRIQHRYLNHTRVVKMFIDEGRIAKVLDHPNIVRTLDAGICEDQYYIAMEYIPGHDVIAIARRSVETGLHFPMSVALGIINQVATGLAHAHTHCDADGRPLQVVHCDISPGNIVVSRRGTTKIVDFGIARATIALREEFGVAGKYSYMAPEQIRSDVVDARADLFSLGIIFYELTLGRRLFRGRPQEVMRKVCEEPIPRPRDVRADYPAALEHILARLLARAPAARYPSAADLRSDLRAYLQGEQGWSKRDIALYLSELFHAPRQEPRLETDREELRDVEEDERELEHAMPSLGPSLEDESEVDPEEDFPEPSAALTAAFKQAAQAPVPELAQGDPPVASASALARFTARHPRLPIILSVVLGLTALALALYRWWHIR